MILQLIVLLVLILLNAFFAASEIAFISLNDTKIEKQAKEGNKKANIELKKLPVTGMQKIRICNNIFLTK